MEERSEEQDHGEGQRQEELNRTSIRSRSNSRNSSRRKHRRRMLRTNRSSKDGRTRSKSRNMSKSGSSSRSRGRGMRRSRSRSRSRSRMEETGRTAGHAHSQLSHEQNRKNTCALCWRKRGRPGSKSLTFRKVTPLLAQVIRDHTHHTTFDRDCITHPSGLCMTDFKGLMAVRKAEEEGQRLRGKDPRVAWRLRDLTDLTFPEAEVGGEDCACPMCHLGQYNPVGKVGTREVKEKPVMNPEGGELEAENQPRVIPLVKPQKRVNAVHVHVHVHVH